MFDPQVATALVVEMMVALICVPESVGQDTSVHADEVVADIDKVQAIALTQFSKSAIVLHGERGALGKGGLHLAAQMSNGPNGAAAARGSTEVS